jgi:hypothetical protein
LKVFASPLGEPFLKPSANARPEVVHLITRVDAPPVGWRAEQILDKEKFLPRRETDLGIIEVYLKGGFKRVCCQSNFVLERYPGPEPRAGLRLAHASDLATGQEPQEVGERGSLGVEALGDARAEQGFQDVGNDVVHEVIVKSARAEAFGDVVSKRTTICREQLPPGCFVMVAAALKQRNVPWLFLGAGHDLPPCW